LSARFSASYEALPLLQSSAGDSKISVGKHMNTSQSTKPRVTQCQKPVGWLGRLILRNMNARHSGVTDWGLAHISVEKHFTILDVGCGGGRTVSKLAVLATEGKVFGVDYSADSVAVASKTNREWIESGRVEIREGSVSQLPFATGTFDLVVAVETHFWWPDLPGDFRETLRVLKPGGELGLIAEVYKGASTTTAKLVEQYSAKTGMKLLSPEEHRELLANAGYSNVEIATEPGKGWIFARGRKG
jgi:SAM-dependent methyltransferase